MTYYFVCSLIYLHSQSVIQATTLTIANDEKHLFWTIDVSG